MTAIFLNGGTDGRSINQGGHGAGNFNGGRGLIYKHDINGSWSGVSTFSSTDGNRAIQFTSRNAQYWQMEQCVLNRNGIPPDSSPSGTSELCKLEGSDNAILDSVLRNSVEHGFLAESASWSIHARRNRIAHSVFENLDGPVAIMRDYLGQVDSQGNSLSGNTRLSDYQIKNCVFNNVAQNPYVSWVNHLLVISLASGMDWTSVISMHGITVRDASRNGDTFRISITGGSNPTGSQTLTWFLANHPSNFSNWTFQTATPFTASLAAATNITANDIATYYTPSGAADGVSLTLANGAGVSSTSLVVDDSRYFTDPRYSTSPQVHVNGANRTYTAINYATHTLTLASAASWSDNAPVNRAITSGTTPNRGPVR